MKRLLTYSGKARDYKKAFECLDSCRRIKTMERIAPVLELKISAETFNRQYLHYKTLAFYYGLKFDDQTL